MRHTQPPPAAVSLSQRLCWVEDSHTLPPFLNNCGTLIHPPATEIWSTLYTVSVKETDFSLGNQNPSTIPTWAGTPAGRWAPQCLWANSVAVGSGTLIIMPSCGKASQRPQLIHVNIEKHLTEVGSNCFPNKWGPGAALLWKWICRVSFQAEDSTVKVPSSKTGRLSAKSSLIPGGHPGDSQVNTDFVFKCESFPKRLAKSDSNQGVGREDRAPKWALWTQSPCPMHLCIPTVSSAADAQKMRPRSRDWSRERWWWSTSELGWSEWRQIPSCPQWEETKKQWLVQKHQKITVKAQTEEKMGKTYTKGVKSKSQTEDAMLKTWGIWVRTNYNIVI